MRPTRTPAAERELRALLTDISRALCTARRRRRLLRWTLVVAALVLALCVLLFGTPI